MDIHPRALRTTAARADGISLLELLFIVAITGTVMAIAIPMSGNALGFYRLSGEARGTSNSISLAKLRASSVFSKVRLFVDLSSNSYHLETWNKTAGTWDAESGTNSLSARVSFGFGSVSTPPPNTQATIGQAPVCKDKDGNDIENTACVIFNTRGVPIDATGAPAVDVLYVTDGTAVYAIAVSASGMVRMWRTPPSATPSWVLQ